MWQEKEEPQEESQEIRVRHCKSDPNRGALRGGSVQPSVFLAGKTPLTVRNSVWEISTTRSGNNNNNNNDDDDDDDDDGNDDDHSRICTR